MGSKRIIIGTILFLILAAVTVGGYFGYQNLDDTSYEEKIIQMNSLVGEGTDRENCKIVLGFERKIHHPLSASITNDFIKLEEQCNKKYDIAFITLDKKICNEIIVGSKGDYSTKYIKLDAFNDIQKQCMLEYFTVKFGTGSFFDINKDFKSSITIDFPSPFFKDIGSVGSKEYLNNRGDAKKRLANLLIVSPQIIIDPKDIILTPKKAIVSLDLQPLSTYTFSLGDNSSDTPKLIQSIQKEKEFILTVPENKILSVHLKNPVSLYMDSRPPEFEIIRYNLDEIQSTTLKICRLDNEHYSKIEMLKGRKGKNDHIDEFFMSGIDDIKTFECGEKEINFSQIVKDGKQTPGKTKTTGLIRNIVTLDDVIGKPSRSGLYFVTFANKEDRKIHDSVFTPILFGIIDSHITMKVSKNGEGYFFVNDFEGKPLPKQKIRVYINNYKDFDSKYNRKTKKSDITYHNPLETSILGKSIALGETNDDGVLKIDLQSVVKGAFGKTFNSDYLFEHNGQNSSFFVTAASETHLTYNHSDWNAGIAPWNFGYKVNGWYWYGNNNDTSTAPTLSKWGRVEKKYYAHTYTDRVLYLPGEQVHIKSILRKSTDLSLPAEDKEFRVVIKDPKGKEIENKRIKVNEFGSISNTFKINKEAKLGYYQVVIKDKDGEYSTGHFSVEVFKNPKFSNNIGLKTEGLNKEEVKIESTTPDTEYSWRNKHTGKFTLTADIDSKYYNGGAVKNANYTYKIYKQAYWGESYWDNCYWGCFWEPKKEFYSEGKGILDKNGRGQFNAHIAFESSYDDYKYIAEVTVTDGLGETITGSNTTIVRLPQSYKGWNSNADIKLSTENNFYKAGKEITVRGQLSHGKWTSDYNDKYLLVIKKKNHKTTYIDDVRGYKRPINSTKEELEKIFLINDSNVDIDSKGKLSFSFIPSESGEYVFEYGLINNGFLKTQNTTQKKEELTKLIKKFNTDKVLSIDHGVQNYQLKNGSSYSSSYLVNTCKGKPDKCSYKYIGSHQQCEKKRVPNKLISGEYKYVEECKNSDSILKIHQQVGIQDILGSGKQFFSIITYGENDAENPVKSDNKVRILAEKVSYKLGEKAKILIRLPFNTGKILWTVEKQGVVKKEYIDVKSNIFFKEIEVDDTFVPNAYIGVVAIPTNPSNGIVPEYKVGYTEIVVDKTEKKSYIEIETNKKTYKPRETVKLTLQNRLDNGKGKKAELSIMVVDDSLISLMGNVDLNTLEKFYKKLPFQIQTSLTNIAMLKNYYFSRPGIVGGSGFGNFKGGDSAVSSRTIFKNTAYYNGHVTTDKDGKAEVEFPLPDNLTNFRIMVVSHSKDNFYGYNSHNIEVRKDVILEEKTPFIYRKGDRTEIGSLIFNNTDAEIGFSVNFSSEDISVLKSKREVMVGAGKSELVTFWTKGSIDSDKEITYTISALGDSKEHSDKITRTIENKSFPTFVQVYSKGGFVKDKSVQNLKIDIPENTDLEKSTVKISFSNNVLEGIEKTLSSLLKYPYGCLEQSISSTYPNAVLLQFKDLFPGIIRSEKAKYNLEKGIKRIEGMQLENGGFGYWHGDSSANLGVTPYALRRLVDMKKYGAPVSDTTISRGMTYLEKNFKNITDNTQRIETFYTFALSGKGQLAYDGLIKGQDTSEYNRHSLIALTYGLYYLDAKLYASDIEKNIETIQILLQNTQGHSYWSQKSDLGLFTSFLIDYGKHDKIIFNNIKKLYAYDWSNYYYSTTAKNNAFIAFAKYIQKYGKNYSSKYAFSIGTIHNRDKRFSLGGDNGDSMTREFKLKDIVQYKENHIELTSYVLGGKGAFTNLTLSAVTKDPLKTKATSNGIQVTREIHEVLDTNRIHECINTNKWSKKSTDCDSILQKVEDNSFKKGTYYRIGITVTFDDKKQRENVALEDYIPSTFKIINSKFKTESSAIKKGNNQSGKWNHIEYLKDRVFANTGKIYQDTLHFEYIVVPQFKGDFLYPPVSAYMMYDGDIRANSKYEMISVK